MEKEYNNFRDLHNEELVRLKDTREMVRLKALSVI